MALFGSSRDAMFIKHINKELINDIIDTEVAYFQIASDETDVNAYGENENGLIYYEPRLVNCLITRDAQSYNEEDYGQDYTQTIKFAFFRDNLIDLNLVPRVGDIVEYNTEYWEIDSLVNNQYWAGKNPDTAYTGADFGLDVSIIISGHLTRKSRIRSIIKYDYNVGLNN